MKLAFRKSEGPVPFVCTAEDCDVRTMTMVVNVDDNDYWDGSACCDNEAHIAEVLAEFNPVRRRHAS